MATPSLATPCEDDGPPPGLKRHLRRRPRDVQFEDLSRDGVPSTWRGSIEMRLEKAWRVWQRAERMLRDLDTHETSLEEHAFPDRLPYVLDLLAGVRRQINEQRHVPQEFRAWWAEQHTAERDAITEMRHSTLKADRRVVDRKTFSQSFCSNGYFNGRPVNSGDSVVVFLGWRFVSGHFDNKDVLLVLRDQLDDLHALLGEAETRLSS